MNKRWNLSLRTICIVAAITLAAMALPAPTFAEGDNNGNGNAFGKNKICALFTDFLERAMAARAPSLRDSEHRFCASSPR